MADMNSSTDFAGTVSLGVTEGQVPKDSASSFHPSFLEFFDNMQQSQYPEPLTVGLHQKKLPLHCLNSKRGRLEVRADAQIALSALAKHGFSSWNFPCSEVLDFLSALAWMDGKNNSLKINSSQEMWKPG